MISEATTEAGKGAITDGNIKRTRRATSLKLQIFFLFSYLSFAEKKANLILKDCHESRKNEFLRANFMTSGTISLTMLSLIMLSKKNCITDREINQPKYQQTNQLTKDLTDPPFHRVTSTRLKGRTHRRNNQPTRCARCVDQGHVLFEKVDWPI